MIWELLQGFANALCLNFALFFLFALCRWNVIPIRSLLELDSKPTPWEEIVAFVKCPAIFPQPGTPQTSISITHSISESCCWLNAFLQDIFFKMADGDLIRSIRESVIEPQINAKLAAIQSEYNKFTGKITLTDLSIRSLPTLTAVHSLTSSCVEKEVSLAFDFEYNGGITFQIVAKPSVVGQVKFDARMDYFKSRLVVQYVKNAGGFPSWSLSLSEAPKISIVLGVGKHNFSGIARIIQKILHDSLQNLIVYPNMYKFVVQPNHIGFGNCFLPVKESLGAHYVIRVVRGRNLPVKHDLKGPVVQLIYGASGNSSNVGAGGGGGDGEKHFKTPTAKCLSSPVWKSTWHFVPLEKHSFLRVVVLQRNKLSKSTVTLASFEIPLALFGKNIFKRVRFRLDGLLLLNDSAATSEHSREATYLSFDIGYWESLNSQSELESMAASLYGSEGAEERAKAAMQRKKPSKLMTILKATSSSGSSTSKKPTSYSSSDLIRYLDGQSSMLFSATSNADLQFIMTSLREKSASLLRFWSQQMEILRGSKGGETSIAAFYDISRVIEEISREVGLFLEAFTKTPESYKELNDVCDHHDFLSSKITQLFRLLSGKFAKNFKFLPQIFEYLKEISQLVGLINQSLYQGRGNLTAADDNQSISNAAVHNPSDDNLFASNASVSNLMVACCPNEEETASMVVVGGSEFYANDSGYSSNDLLEEQSCNPMISVSPDDSERIDSTLIAEREMMNSAFIGGSDQIKDTSVKVSANRINSTLNADVANRINSTFQSAESANKINSTLHSADSATAPLPIRISPSPSVASSIGFIQPSSSNSPSPSASDQGSFCRLFKSRSLVLVGKETLEFRPNFEKLLLSSQEGMFYLVDAEAVSRIYNEKAFSTFKSDKRVLGTVSHHRITFSKPEAPPQSTVAILSTQEISKITIKNVANSHLNLLKIESCQTGMQPVYVAGEKGMLLHFFAAIASWMVYYDALASSKKNENSTAVLSYQIPYVQITGIKSTKCNLIVFFRAKTLVSGVCESISNSALMLRDFFDSAQRQSCLNSLIPHLPSGIGLLSGEDDDSFEEERQDFVFSRSSSPSGLPTDYYFVHFKLQGRGDPRAIEECSIDGGGPSGEVSVGNDGIYWWWASSSGGGGSGQYVIPFSQIQTLKMVGGSLLGGFGGLGTAKGIRIGLVNGSTLSLTGFRRKGARQAFFNDAFLALSK